MRPTILCSAALGFSALVAWMGLGPFSDTAVARAGNLSVLQDKDGDGLDDAHEVLFLSHPGQTDIDGDYASDLLEWVRDTDPNDPQSGASTQLEPDLKVGVYALHDQVVITLAALHAQSVTWDRSWLLLPHGTREIAPREWGQFFRRRQRIDTSIPGQQGPWFVETVSLKVPRAVFDRWPTKALAFSAVVDGKLIGSYVSLIEISGVLAEVRLDEGSTPPPGVHYAAGQQGGGVFPVEPGNNGVPDGEEDNLCLQILAPIGLIRPGVVAYQVVDASCVPMIRAYCFVSCPMTVGETGVMVDLPGLLGG